MIRRPAGVAADSVTAALDAQVEAWNRGDIEAFCALCAEEVVYVGASGVRRGREAVRDGYLRNYPDRAAMGALSLELESLDERGDTAIAVVRWAVRADAEHGGHALLVFERRDGGWWLAWDATIARVTP